MNLRKWKIEIEPKKEWKRNFKENEEKLFVSVKYEKKGIKF